MATNDVNLQVINSMTQEQMQSLKDSDGKIPSLANQLIMTDEEDVNLSQLRTEVVYDMTSSDSNKNWDYTSGINGGITVSGKDFSKYKYLIITCADNRASGSVNNTWANTATLDLTVTRSAVSGFFTSLITASVSTSNFYKVVASIQVNNAKTSISLTNTALDSSGNGFSAGSTDFSIIKIEGILKEPAMIYTGKELHEGNGISIQNGVISSDLQYTQLWENPNINTSFPAQTITLDLTNYKFLMITFYSRGDWKTQGYYFSNIIPIDGTTYTACYFDINNRILKRPITATKTGVNFGEGDSPTASESVWANQPLKIYGI